jgi:hypothetical protein
MNHTIGQPLRISSGPVHCSLVRGIPIREVADLFESCVHKFAWVQPYLNGPDGDVYYARVGIVLGVLPDKAIVFQRTADTPPIVLTPKQTLRESYQLFRLEGGFSGLTMEDCVLMQTTAAKTSRDDLVEAQERLVHALSAEDIAAAEAWTPEFRRGQQAASALPERIAAAPKPAGAFGAAGSRAAGSRAAGSRAAGSRVVETESESESESSDSSEDSVQPQPRVKRWPTPPGSPPPLQDEGSAAKRPRV